jgi:hypothetical protein
MSSLVATASSLVDDVPGDSSPTLGRRGPKVSLLRRGARRANGMSRGVESDNDRTRAERSGMRSANETRGEAGVRVDKNLRFFCKMIHPTLFSEVLLSFIGQRFGTHSHQ